MAYLFACNVGTLVSVPFDTRVRGVPAARLCIYASGAKPLREHPRGNVLVFKDEGIDEVFAEQLPGRPVFFALNERLVPVLLAVVLHVVGWLSQEEHRIRTGSKEITF